MKHIYLFFFLVFPSWVFSQGQIINITVDPANPTTNDEVKVYVELIFTSGGCDLDNSGHSTTGNNTNAYAHHCVGMLTVICNITDTFDLGYLQQGNHEFGFTLSSGFGGPGCTAGIIADDADTLSFTVSATNSIDEKLSNAFQFYPNPSNGNITVEVNDLWVNEKTKMVITDLSGKEILQSDINATSTNLDLSAFSEGIYFLQLVKNGVVVEVKKLVVG